MVFCQVQVVSNTQQYQSTHSQLEVHTFAWKIARCFKYMGVNNMHDHFIKR